MSSPKRREFKFISIAEMPMADCNRRSMSIYLGIAIASAFGNEKT